MNTYCVQVTDGTVTWVTVGDDPEWCVQNLGGEWVLSEELVGIGWTLDGIVFAPPRLNDDETGIEEK
jgi:hypothetical protein